MEACGNVLPHGNSFWGCTSSSGQSQLPQAKWVREQKFMLSWFWRPECPRSMSFLLSSYLLWPLLGFWRLMAVWGYYHLFSASDVTWHLQRMPVSPHDHLLVKILAMLHEGPILFQYDSSLVQYTQMAITANKVAF